MPGRACQDISVVYATERVGPEATSFYSYGFAFVNFLNSDRAERFRGCF